MKNISPPTASSLNRRTFLTGSLAVGSAWTLRSSASARPQQAVRVGIIGTANRATANWGGVVREGKAEIVSAADVDEKLTEGLRKAHPKAKFYNDFRKLIDAKGIDAVVISTADHTHFHAAYYAMQAGLHVYCEKPLTHTVWEARRLIQLAKEKKLVTQMGTQIHAGNNYRRVVEQIHSGVIGQVKEVHTWVPNNYSARANIKISTTIPANFDYKLWLGPVDDVPYSSEFHPFHWRRYWAFGGGALADMACHHMDLPFWALNLRHPKTIEAKSSPVLADSCCEWAEVTYQYEINQKPIMLRWYDGGKKPTDLLEKLKLSKMNAGNLFVGEKGYLTPDYGTFQAYDTNGNKIAPAAVVQPIANSVGHYKEWVDAITSGGTTTCNFDYSGTLTEAVLLGTVAIRSQAKVDWDGEKCEARNAAAQAYIRKNYRQGWQVS